MDFASSNFILNIVLFVIGVAILVKGSDWFVDAAAALARSFKVPELVIGLTLVSIGTSLPELATSVVAALKHEQDIAIGNVVGSNIFNILSILGISPMIKPVAARDINYLDFGVMLGVALALWLMMIFGKKITRTEGAFFLLINTAYVGYLVYRVI